MKETEYITEGVSVVLRPVMSNAADLKIILSLSPHIRSVLSSCVWSFQPRLIHLGIASCTSTETQSGTKEDTGSATK